MPKDEYLQSNWPMLRVSHLYYYEGKTTKEISDITKLSASTITRLLQRARETDIVRTVISEKLISCIHISDWISQRYGLQFTIIVPLRFYQISPIELDERKRNIELNGARYLQHIIRPTDVLGVDCGKFIENMTYFLNPCFRLSCPFVTLNGTLPGIASDTELMMSRFARVFGRNGRSFRHSGLLGRDEDPEALLREKDIQAVFSEYERLTLSISGFASCYPDKDSPFEQYLEPEEKRRLMEQGACGELLYHFFDRDGKELDTGLKNRTLSIGLDTYRKIPKKIILAAGDGIEYSLQALLRGGMADILITDEYVGEKLMRLDKMN